MSRDTAKFSYLCILISLCLGLSSCGLFSTKDDTKKEKADLYYSHGTSELVNQRYTAALDALLKAHQLRPEDSKITNNLGMAYYFKGDKARAVEYLELSLKIDPKNSDARNNLASIYFEQGKLQAAWNQYQAIRADLVYQNQFRVLYNMALISLKKGELKTAEELLTLSLNEKSDYCPAHYQLGLLLNKKNQYQKALEAFQEASKGTCYSEPAPHYQQAMNLIKLGQTQKAKLKLDEMKEKFPNSPYIHVVRNELERFSNQINIGNQINSQDTVYSSTESDWDLDEMELRKKLEEIENSKL